MGSKLNKVSISSGETRPFEGDSGQLQLVETEEGAVGLATFKPGWRWSENVKPIAGTDSCQVAHIGYVISGSMTVRMDDGQETTISAGDVMIAPAGHDAWIEGDEDCVIVDWAGMSNYAKR
jgi:quercetin dioxygenase-like cupin family protein